MMSVASVFSCLIWVTSSVTAFGYQQRLACVLISWKCRTSWRSDRMYLYRMLCARHFLTCVTHSSYFYSHACLPTTSKKLRRRWSFRYTSKSLLYISSIPLILSERVCNSSICCCCCCCCRRSNTIIIHLHNPICSPWSQDRVQKLWSGINTSVKK